jgi:VWFA-related protein
MLMHLAPLLVTFLVLSGPLVVAGQTPSSKETHGASANAGHSTVPAIAKDVAVTVTALDDSGRPVTDLTSADFQVFDNDKLQTISSVRSNPAQLAAGTAAPGTTLILFDQLNAIPLRRAYFSTLIVQALEPVGTGESVYLYLLTNHGDLYPVHGLPAQEGAKVLPTAGGAMRVAEPSAVPWTSQVHPLLDQAIENVYGFRLVDDKDFAARSGKTFLALGEVGQQLARILGPKTIVWITTGVWNRLDFPYGCKDVLFSGESGSFVAGKCGVECARWGTDKCVDYGPFLRKFTAQLVRTNTVINSVEVTREGTIPRADRGTAGDTLEQLSRQTGGKVYLNNDVGKAISDSFANARGRYQIVYAGASADGKYHKLRLVCARAGVHLQAQQGYFAAQP